MLRVCTLTALAASDVSVASETPGQGELAGSSADSAEWHSCASDLAAEDGGMGEAGAAFEDSSEDEVDAFTACRQRIGDGSEAQK